jgi:hypothetical protein
MALTSPGVQVSVIDESFYTPAEPGTTPLIFVATAQDKTNPGGTGVAPGTTKANAGKVYLMSSQRELSETFGDPVFQTDASNNPVHAGEQNEYGLQAAYSFLGVANRAYVVRADLDLNEITGSATEAAGKPADGAWWFDTDDTKYGVFEWNGSAASTTNGQTFTNKVPTIITDSSQTSGSAPYTPKTSVGAIGDYAVVAVSNVNRLWYKNSSGAWVEVGSDAWRASWPFASGTAGASATSTGTITFTINGAATVVTTTGTTLNQIVSDINTAGSAVGISASSTGNKLNLFYDGRDTAVNSIVMSTGSDVLTDCGIPVGTYRNTSFVNAPHTSVPEWKTRDASPAPTGSVWIKSTDPNLGAKWSVKQYSASADEWTTVSAPMYATNHAAIADLDSSNGGAGIAAGSVYVRSNVAEDVLGGKATFQIMVRAASGATSITSAAITASTFPAGAATFQMQSTSTGSASLSTLTTVSMTFTGTITDADEIAGAINGAGVPNVSASVNSKNQVIISHANGGEIRFVDGTNTPLNTMFTVYDSTNPNSTNNFYFTPGTDSSTSPRQFNASNWNVLTYTAKATAPTATPATGQLWYSSVIDEVDMMIHDGTTWVGYRNFDHAGDGNVGSNSAIDDNGPIVSASEPTTQSDGTTALQNGDLWISTADLENYPTIYKYNGDTSKWVLVDKTDQTTEAGVLFADARYNTTGANSDEAGDIADLIDNNYLDPDAPDPALYPKGMLLWNTRRSGFNVKRYERNYIDTDSTNPRFNNDESMSGYHANRWVTESANNADGSGSFGRNAQRKVVVQALQASVNSNEDIRDDESRNFNLIAAPGYPELIGEMNSLNNDRGLTAFVVGDSPFRLASSTTDLQNWSSNVNLAVEDNDNGLVTRNEYLGVYYPSGFTSDNAGNNVVVPPSHMALRTIALNDQVAYPWFAPAGTRRGSVTNATASGYVNSEGEFVSVALNEGQRDTLYSNAVNPITFINGAGLVVFGQKTRAANASALDRINVARLTVYLRSQLKKLAKPYIFEPNDKITRDEIKQQVESLMVELVGLRAIFDYLVVCDETNNTPARIDRNELYVDIAIEPVKAVEFIYIPLRLKNTGEIASL